MNNIINKIDKILLKLQLYTSLIIPILIQKYSLPNTVYFVYDVFYLYIFMKLLFLLSKRKVQLDKKLVILFLLQFSISIFTFIINRTPFLAYLLGIRNAFKYIVLFFAYNSFGFNKDDVAKTLKNLNFIAIFEEFFCLYQYFVIGLRQDAIGGTFGFGGTGLIGEFLLINLMYLLILYKNKKLKLIIIIMQIIMFLIVISIGEIKVFFIIMPIMVLLILLKGKFKLKNILLILILILMLKLSITCFGNIYIRQKYALRIENIINSLEQKNYTGGTEQLGRFYGIKYINKYLLTDYSKKLFGVGLGNATPSNIDYLQGDYYKRYGSLSYYWIFIQYYLLENGYVGLLLYSLVLIIIYNRVNKIYINNKEISIKIYIELIKALIILCFLCFFYNAGFYTSAVANVFWFILSIGYNKSLISTN